MRTRLFLAFLLIVLVTTTAIVGLTTWRLRQDIDQFIHRGGLTGSEELVQALEAHYAAKHSWAGAASVMTGHHGGFGPGSGGPGTLADAGGQVVFSRGGGMGGMAGKRLSDEDLASAIPLYDGREIVGYLLPETRLPPLLPGIELSLIARLTRSALLAAAFAIALSLLLAFGLAYVLLRPVQELTEAARGLEKGDLSRRVVPRGGAELSLLARTFNRMAESLQIAEERRRALTADIAHELRNPLAVQRANLEALQDGLYPLTLDQLEPIVRQNQLLERLVEDLRTLALADAGHLQLERISTDIIALTNKRVSDLKAEADSRQVRFEVSSEAECPLVEVDPTRCGQILTNILTNALRHTPDGTSIRVAIDCRRDDLRLTVHDSGPGIDPRDLPHIFERFYKGDPARSRAGGSTGLGLSIARRLAEAHGGELHAANHPLGGAVFTLTLPLHAK